MASCVCVFSCYYKTYQIIIFFFLSITFYFNWINYIEAHFAFDDDKNERNVQYQQNDGNIYSDSFTSVNI